MRAPIHLTFEALVALLGRKFEHLPDRRNADSVEYPMRDTAMAAFAMFFFQQPSLLAFQRQLEEATGRSNLETIFGVSSVPSDTQLREILDGAPYEPLRRTLAEVFERHRRSGWAAEFRTSASVGGGLYPIAIDGTDYFSSTKVGCPQCLRSDKGRGVTLFRHSVLAATLVKPGHRRILPMDAEPVLNTDGAEKQDCETRAAERLLVRLRREHPKLPMLILGDAIFAHEPTVALLVAARLSFLLSVKEGSQPETFEWVEEMERVGDWIERVEWVEGAASKRRYFEARICRQMPLSQARTHWVTFVEVWERTTAGRVVYHNSWVTDLEVSAGNVAEVVRVARSRWKVENEQFNVHKNGGYELEHNYGHGTKGLSTFFYFLNLLAFVAHQVLERSDRGYRGLRERMPLREVWEGLRFCFRRFVVESWAALIGSFDPEQSQASP